MTSTKYTISAANRITGKSRTTLAAHMKSGKLSYERDANGAKVIDGAELVRVYGSECDFSREEGADHSNVQGKGRAVSSDDQSLHSQLTSVQQQLDAQVEERKRERQQFQEQIDHLRDTLKLAQEGHNKAMLLLEHRTAGGGELESSLKTLEARIADQLTGVKQQLAEVRDKTRRETIDDLKSVSWFRTVFRLLRE